MGVRQQNVLSNVLSNAQNMRYEDNKELNLCIIIGPYIYIYHLNRDWRTIYKRKSLGMKQGWTSLAVLYCNTILMPWYWYCNTTLKNEQYSSNTRKICLIKVRALLMREFQIDLQKKLKKESLKLKFNCKTY